MFFYILHLIFSPSFPFCSAVVIWDGFEKIDSMCECAESICRLFCYGLGEGWWVVGGGGELTRQAVVMMTHRLAVCDCYSR